MEKDSEGMEDLETALAGEERLSPPAKKKSGLVVWTAFGMLAAFILYIGYTSDRSKANAGPPTIGEGGEEFVPGAMRPTPPAPQPSKEAQPAAVPAPYMPPPQPAPTVKDMTAEEKLAYLRQRSPLMVEGGSLKNGVEEGSSQPTRLQAASSQDPFVRDDYGAVVGLRGLPTATSDPMVTGGAPGGLAPPQQARGPSNDEAFWEKARQTTVIRVKATPPEDLQYVVSEGKLIDGVLESAINSDLPGKVRAMIDEDVYGDQGRTVLLPRMTRLIGEYNSQVRNGQTRLFVMWTRAIKPDGSSISLGSPGSDSLGRSGLSGIVDGHWFKRFGTAILLSIIGSAGQAAVSQGADAAAAYYRLEISRNIAQTANEALRYNITIPPTIHIDQGTRIKVFVAQDLDFRDAMQPARSAAQAAESPMVD